MKKKIALVFDIDDTLYSQMEPLLGACEDALGYKLADPELFYRIFCRRSGEMFLFSESGKVSIEESRIYRIENTMKDMGIPFTRAQAVRFQKKYKENQSRLRISGVFSRFFDECKEHGIKMGIITNGPYKHQVEKFYTLGLDKWFSEDQLLVSAGVGVAKPDRGIFQMAEEKWGLEPETTYMIGDSLENDITGARNSGWKSIWMNHHKYALPEGAVAPDWTVYTEVELCIRLRGLLWGKNGEKDMPLIREEMRGYDKIFDQVRLLRWENLGGNDLAREAFLKRTELARLAMEGNDFYQVTVRYLEIDGVPYVMELRKALDKTCFINPEDREKMIRNLTGYDERLYRDALTNAYNRRYYEDVIKKKQGPAGVAMLDLDDFKVYNDTYGHSAGDSALCTVANVIIRHIRKTDTLIRYGGDEFLLVLSDVAEADFAQRLQEIHDKIRMAVVPGYSGIQLSVSIGGSIASAKETVESVLGRADRFMYQAKIRKNLVVTESNEIKDGNAEGDSVKREELNHQVLIIDDSEFNRELLSEILQPEFQSLEAGSGEEGLAMLREYGTKISLVLLDIVMPGMDGFGVLAEMNRNHWLEDIPVIMISSEETELYIRRAYEMGVSDYISRPFDAKVVYRRVYNTIKLYVKQRRLITLVTAQIREKEKNNQILVDVLSQIVEFRNGESGLHVQHIKKITERLLEQLAKKTDRYELQWSDQYMITVASALHDIGKVGISEKILNKPGALTQEEYEEMKNHTLIGASMLERLGVYQDEELVKVAYQICRWHHERYDGNGYPDGLKGEEIPIAAQVVSVADVYDALISERVYKKAYSREEALEMIMNGECGVFNPLLLECLGEIARETRMELAD